MTCMDAGNAVFAGAKKSPDVGHIGAVFINKAGGKKPH